MPADAESPEDAALHERIRALAAGASIEAAVKNLAEIDAYPRFLAAGAEIYLPWLPGLPYSHVVSIASRLKAAGYVPVPHIAARRLPDAASLEDLAGRLAGEAGVQQALVIGGDVDRPAGPFDSAVSLLQTGLLQRHGIRRIGVAGYPEGHPRISEAELTAALHRKAEIGRATGLELYVVSQFCFDGSAILKWMRRLAAEGVTLPLHVGLAGPARLRTLINYGMRCGVGPSLRALRSHGVSLTRLVAQSGPEGVVAELARAPEADRRAFKLHFFSFGGVEKTAQWMRAAADGRFRLRAAQLEMIA